MKLYLVRHGIAEEASLALTDSERALTPEGRTKMRKAVQGLKGLDVRLDLVLTSPLRRARETAEILATVLAGIEVKVLEELALGGAPGSVLAALRPFRSLEALALVGHQPDLGYLASLLLSGSATLAPLPFKKGSVACFDGDVLRSAGRAQLEWFLTPKQLRQLAGA